MQENNFYEKNETLEEENIPLEPENQNFEEKTEQPILNQEPIQEPIQQPTPQPIPQQNPTYRYVQYIPYGFTPKTFEERKEIKKCSNVASISLVLVSAISFLWSVIYIAFMISIGFTYNKAYEIINEPAAMQVLQIVLSSFLFTVPFIIVYKIGGYRISDLVILKKPKKENRLSLFLLGISFCSFANIAVSYMSSLFSAFGINYEVDFGDNPEGFFGFMLSLIATVFVPALVEEFALRGLVLGSLKKYGDGFAILCSSIIFGIMHGNFQQIPFAFLVGLILGYITIKSGSLWIAVAVHAFNNFISVFFEYFIKGIHIQNQNVIYTCYLSIALILGLVGIFLLKNNDGNLFKLEKGDNECKENQKYKWLFLSPFMIIFISVEFLLSLSFFK